mmetsp:Transcript_24629/g.59284  ORF Transcript_24629/g.59284 Transcript_24629/m.59284 type:complete len:215 (+) Transcript_24629:2928-3572(+)
MECFRFISMNDFGRCLEKVKYLSPRGTPSPPHFAISPATKAPTIEHKGVNSISESSESPKIPSVSTLETPAAPPVILRCRSLSFSAIAKTLSASEMSKARGARSLVCWKDKAAWNARWTCADFASNPRPALHRLRTELKVHCFSALLSMMVLPKRPFKLPFPSVRISLTCALSRSTLKRSRPTTLMGKLTFESAGAENITVLPVTRLEGRKSRA